MSIRGAGLDRCEWVMLVVDDVRVPDPETYWRTLDLSTFESIEYLTPIEAGFRYGLDAGASGVLVFWSRGSGPHISGSRNRW